MTNTIIDNRFTHLHVHTEYSMLDGISKISDLVTQTKALGMDSIAITDHGSMYGVVDFYQACKEAAVKPIIGCEVYVAKGSRFDKSANERSPHHLLLLARDNAGYRNLMELVTRAHVDGFHYRPRIDRELLEKHLFACSYKGVTDLVTKWLWPGPARRAVKFCVEHDIKPNQVTLVGFFLAILAGLFFYQGWYGPGLAAGWLMTFLDTVDGKLARVTLTSSKFGHLFDHAIDIIHPPLWYLAWGVGLAGYGLPLTAGSWTAIVWMILAGYLGGRIVEAVFTQFLGRFGIFCWQPRDSWFRLVTGRRNPCLVLLTLSWLGGRPDLGLWAVAWWSLLSTMYLGLRLFRALQARRRGPLRSWFESIDHDHPDPRLALSVKIFTRKPTRLPDGSRG